MKKFDSLGRSLTKGEQKLIKGGVSDDGCTATYTGCNNSPGMGLTCDYQINCSGGQSWTSCETVCNSGDGGGCR